MFERFTDGARRAVVLAQENARMLNHEHIGTEHLLLGLVHEEDCAAAEVLTSLGVTLADVRRNVEDIVGRGEHPPTAHIPFTPRGKKVLELALREALQLGQSDIGTEHILLGLLREEEGIGARVLARLGMAYEGVIAAVTTRLADAPVEHAGEGRAEVRTASVAFERRPREPSCPRCRSVLRESLTYRTLVVAGEGDLPDRPASVPYCRVCGTALGILPLE